MDYNEIEAEPLTDEVLKGYAIDRSIQIAMSTIEKSVDRYGQTQIDTYSLSNLCYNREYDYDLLKAHIDSGKSRYRLQRYTNGRFEYDVVVPR